MPQSDVDAPPASCSEHSLRAGEPLAGTATTARRWLLVEHGGVWGRDAVADSGLPPAVRERFAAWEAEEPGSRVLLIRRPGEGGRAGRTPAVLVASCAEPAGSLRRVPVERLDDLAGADLSGGEGVAGPLFLVCTHGRRDACCARLGRPVYDALARAAGPGSVWQSSHQGGHRLAGCVLVLPDGLHLGRVTPAVAPDVVASADAGRVPLDHYRGRVLYGASGQVAEIEVRRALGLVRVEDVRLVAEQEGLVTFAAPGGEHTVAVTDGDPLEIPVSCGREPETVFPLGARLVPAT